MRTFTPRWIWIGLLAALLVAPAVPAAEEGRHYYEVPFPQAPETGAQIEVREIFWYGCPACNRLEPGLNAWLKKGLPKNAAFRRTPGMREGWVQHARLYYTLEKLGIVEQHHSAVFDAIHKDGLTLDSVDRAADFLARRGVDAKKFRSTWESFDVRFRLERALQYNRETGVGGVPSFVIDGRYVTSVGLAGGDDKIFPLLEELVARAARERQKAPARP
jgi:thiol:disulfide interchange protein DsbA